MLIGAKFSRSFLFRGFIVIRDDVVLLRMIRLVAPRAQRVGGPQREVLTSLGTEVLVVLIEGLSSVLLRKNV